MKVRRHWSLSLYALFWLLLILFYFVIFKPFNCFIYILLQKLRPVRKQFMVDHSLVLVNDFIAFISQIHGMGNQKQYEKGSTSKKFNKLTGDQGFEADCCEFFQLWGESEKTAGDLIGMFTKVCNEKNSKWWIFKKKLVFMAFLGGVERLIFTIIYSYGFIMFLWQATFISLTLRIAYLRF